MSKIIKMNVLDTMCDFKSFFQITFPILVCILVYLTNGIPDSKLIFLKLYSADLAIFVMTFSIVVSNITVVEKVSHRLEFYLANNVKINKLLCAYSFSVFYISFGVMILFNLLVWGYAIVFNDSAFLSAIINENYLLALGLCTLLGLTVSFLSNIFVFIIKDASLVRTCSFFISLIIIFGTGFSIQFLGGFNVAFEILLYRIFVTCLATTFLLFILCLVLRKKISNEKIILSFN